jgi:hypothetical protein
MEYHEEMLKELYQWRDDLHRTCQGSAVVRAMERRIQDETDERRLKPLYFLLAQEHEAQGNYAAAEVSYHQDPIDEVHRWCEQLEKTSVGVDLIRAIEERMDGETHPAKQRELKFILAQEHLREDDCAASEVVYLQLFAAVPDDPMPLIKLAEQKLYFERQPAAAMRIIDRAIEVAYEYGSFRRNALSVKARIALATKDCSTIESVLSRIIELGFEQGNIDTGIMRDFFDRLPPGSIDPELARQYDEHCRLGATNR